MTSITSSCADPDVRAIVMELESVGYFELESGFSAEAYAGRPAIATIVVEPEAGRDQDTALWHAFVHHRKALFALGFRLTMPSFTERTVEAMIERLPGSPADRA